MSGSISFTFYSKDVLNTSFHSILAHKNSRVTIETKCLVHMNRLSFELRELRRKKTEMANGQMNVLKFKLTLNTCKVSNNTLSDPFAIGHTSHIRVPYIWLVSFDTRFIYSLIYLLHFVYSISQMKLCDCVLSVLGIGHVWCTLFTCMQPD